MAAKQGTYTVGTNTNGGCLVNGLFTPHPCMTKPVFRADGKAFNADAPAVSPTASMAKPTPKTSTSLMDKLKDNKFLVIGIVAVVAIGGYMYLKHKHKK